MRNVPALAVLCIVIAGCAAPSPPGLSIEQARAKVAAKLPEKLPDRAGWATDIHAAMEALRVELSDGNICAVVAVTEQESGFQVDPVVPNLAAAAWKEIETQREHAGIPSLALQAALALPSTTGRSYRERIDAAHTERELSDVFEDFIGRVPLGRTFLEDRNPIRTAGPMQVSVAFAREFVASNRYPYPMPASMRDELFSRRGGMYFGIAHLLAYEAPYDRYVYRFADFNAGRYSSRNAAFQRALASATGAKLAYDGALLRYEKGKPAEAPSATEIAARSLGPRLALTPERIRSSLELGRSREFEETDLYARVFEIAAARGAQPPRAAIPQIELHSVKITRPLTTEWFANRVADRHRRCMGRGAG
jgi:hypothetical protein